MRIENPHYRIVMENEQTGNAVAISVVSFVGAVKFIRRTARRLGMELVSFRRPDGSEWEDPYKVVPDPVASREIDVAFWLKLGRELSESSRVADTLSEWAERRGEYEPESK